ncbi:TPA: hypothetical protein NBR33_000116 [Acinetobacter nosocomialis]|nr:hypothetical protein [Acinetobacter nosocomialis]
MYTQQELVNIASYGGGLELDAAKHTVADLTNIASYAASKGARITISLKNKKLSVVEMTNIASYGQGSVSYKDIY